MAAIIETKDLTKHYGSVVAIQDLSLNVEEGAIYGFVGPNGAGKTTTMQILTTLLQPTAGEAYVAGYSVTKNPREVRRAIGYMPDFFGVYDDMKVWEYLDFFAACYDIPEAERGPLIRDLLELVDLSHRADAMVDSLSRGMKQRLCLARTLAHDPQVLILDEPASGLDPRARIEIRQLLVELANMGKTIFFSTHILADVQEICTQVGIIEAGRLVMEGDIEEMQRRLVPHREILITLLGPADAAKEFLFGREGVELVEEVRGENGRSRLHVSLQGDDQAVSGLLADLVRQGIPVMHFTEETRDLESVFMRATKGIVS
ncbi:MAG TPA: ABC transporter ATP-binding protein [Aggregatilineales bacterium]|nr:ABC transporter ATP-binding protein [Aggregatilineales bacterium]HPV07163.1 ABC transporter ATP-binding protein [Aggregatilineales bacterium]HQA66841.1 ABC transporter ATP-binding protein [Aggregatilineales bacterium]HQE17077.1 ABC transporter ATP-binding protein [Aggregatilineales bacterium]